MTTLSTPAQVLLGSLIANNNVLLFNVITEELNQTTITAENNLLAEVCFNKHTAIKQAQKNRELLCLISNGQTH